MFLRTYELDGFLPQDWQLQIRVMNKGTISNSLIGEMEIDLEDRLMGEPKLKERFAFVIYKDFYEKEIEKIRLDYS